MSFFAGFEDPLLTAAAQGASPNSYMLMPWTYTPSLALTFSSVDEPVQYFESVTGKPYNFSMLSWNSSDVGAFLPLIQQKKMITGKGQGSIPQNMLEYRGVPFFNKTWGAINVTGVNEGVAFGSNVDENRTVLTWDSVLSRPVNAAFSGNASEQGCAPPPLMSSVSLTSWYRR